MSEQSAMFAMLALVVAGASTALYSGYVGKYHFHQGGGGPFTWLCFASLPVMGVCPAGGVLWTRVVCILVYGPVFVRAVFRLVSNPEVVVFVIDEEAHIGGYRNIKYRPAHLVGSPAVNYWGKQAAFAVGLTAIAVSIQLIVLNTPRGRF